MSIMTDDFCLSTDKVTLCSLHFLFTCYNSKFSIRLSWYGSCLHIYCHHTLGYHLYQFMLLFRGSLIKSTFIPVFKCSFQRYLFKLLLLILEEKLSFLNISCVFHVNKTKSCPCTNLKKKFTKNFTEMSYMSLKVNLHTFNGNLPYTRILKNYCFIFKWLT